MTTLGSTRLLAVTPRGILLLREKTRSDKHQNVDGVVTIHLNAKINFFCNKMFPIQI